MSYAVIEETRRRTQTDTGETRETWELTDVRTFDSKEAADRANDAFLVVHGDRDNIRYKLVEGEGPTLDAIGLIDIQAYFETRLSNDRVKRAFYFQLQKEDFVSSNWFARPQPRETIEALYELCWRALYGPKTLTVPSASPF